MTLPNKLTLLRVLFIPVLVIIAYIPYLNETSFYGQLSLANFINFIIFIIAAFTDQLDGMIARKKNLITTFGKFADPLADKILVLAALIILMLQQGKFGPVIPGWVVVVILSREFIVTGVRIMAIQGGKVIPAGILGKIKTVISMIALAVLFLYQLHEAVLIIGTVLLYLATLFTVLSGVEYFWKNREIIFESI